MDSIKLLRKSRKMSQQSLANALGVSRSTIAMWETAGSQPDNASLLQLADYFGVTVDFLLGREDEKAKKEVAALSDDDLDYQIIKLLSELSPQKQQLALDLLQTLKDHEA